MIKVHFESYFKGGRDYIHGTDVFNGIQSAVQQHYGSSAYVKSLVFRSISKTCGVIFLQCDKVPEGFVVSANFKVVTGDEEIIGLFATYEEPVIEHKGYDENLVMTTALIDEEGQFIHQTHKTVFTSIEEAVALTKFLHNKLLLPPQGAWMFTMIDVKDSSFLGSNELFKVKLKQNLGGKMTRSELIMGGKTVATIGFTVLQ